MIHSPEPHPAYIEIYFACKFGKCNNIICKEKITVSSEKNNHEIHIYPIGIVKMDESIRYFHILSGCVSYLWMTAGVQCHAGMLQNGGTRERAKFAKREIENSIY